jgi:hypothetical protein
VFLCAFFQCQATAIPFFLRLFRSKKEFFPQTKIMMKEYEQHVKHIATLKLLKQSENNLHENISI